MLKYIVISYTIIILLLSVLPINGEESFLNDNFILSVRLDYLAHFALFIPWMLLVWLYAGAGSRVVLLKAVLWILAGLLLAMISEGAQYLLSYRAFNINDLVANMLGVLLGSVFFFFKRPRVIVDS